MDAEFAAIPPGTWTASLPLNNPPEFALAPETEKMPSPANYAQFSIIQRQPLRAMFRWPGEFHRRVKQRKCRFSSEYSEWRGAYHAHGQYGVHRFFSGRSLDDIPAPAIIATSCRATFRNVRQITGAQKHLRCAGPQDH